VDKKVMRLLDLSTGLMECRVCGKRHWANIQSGADRAANVARYYRGSWQCSNGCKLPETKAPPG
jgi:hypothetical protein